MAPTVISSDEGNHCPMCQPASGWGDVCGQPQLLWVPTEQARDVT